MEENGDAKSSVLSSSQEEEEEESPPRIVVCLKNKEDMKRFEETEDCFILGFDPSDESLPPSKIISMQENVDLDLSLLSEKGPVACRDYPHPRHLCLNFPFATTSHQSYCLRCYCYVCDSAAPCKYWTKHCDADGADQWKKQRQAMNQIYTPKRYI